MQLLLCCEHPNDCKQCRVDTVAVSVSTPEGRSSGQNIFGGMSICDILRDELLFCCRPTDSIMQDCCTGCAVKQLAIHQMHVLSG